MTFQSTVWLVVSEATKVDGRATVAYVPEARLSALVAVCRVVVPLIQYWNVAWSLSPFGSVTFAVREGGVDSIVLPMYGPGAEVEQAASSAPAAADIVLAVGGLGGLL